MRKLRDQGDPVPTGIAVLEERTRDGMRPGKALVIGGTAGAGKTALAVQIMRAGAEAGCVVGGLFSDEGREPAIIRLGQQFGYERDALEAVDHPAHDATLAALERDLATLDIFFPDPDADADTTLKGVVESLVQAHPGRRKVVVVDSIQTVRTGQTVQDVPSLRERNMGNARLARALAVEHGLVMIYTSEVNRSWYRARKEEDRASDLAAFAEARIEFSGDVLLAMRAMDQDPDIVEVRIPKMSDEQDASIDLTPEERVKEAMLHPGYQNIHHPEHAAVLQKVHDLVKQAWPDPPAPAPEHPAQPVRPSVRLLARQWF